jgi:hypothetical protein
MNIQDIISILDVDRHVDGHTDPSNDIIENK